VKLQPSRDIITLLILMRWYVHCRSPAEILLLPRVVSYTCRSRSAEIVLIHFNKSGNNLQGSPAEDEAIIFGSDGREAGQQGSGHSAWQVRSMRRTVTISL
jgi:hypothetical protein